MFALAVMPFLNWSYSGHGGISWFLVPLCSPWIFARAVIKIWRSSGATCRWYLRFYKITIPFYVALALPFLDRRDRSQLDVRLSLLHVAIVRRFCFAVSVVVFLVIPLCRLGG